MKFQAYYSFNQYCLFFIFTFSGLIVWQVSFDQVSRTFKKQLRWATELHFSITIAMSEQEMLLDAQVISELKLSELISESLEALYPTMATDDDSTMATNND